MKKILTVALACGLLGTSLSATAAQKIVAGGTCSKAGESKTIGKLKFICTKSGKKLFWKEKKSSNPAVIPSASPTPSASPSPTPTFTPAKAPESFQDLYENRAGISYAAWSKTKNQITSNGSKLGELQIYTGPKTKVEFDDYSNALQLMSKAFPTNKEPEKIIVIRFNAVDANWADAELKRLISAADYAAILRNDSRPVLNNCDGQLQNCMGSRQITTNSGVALIIQGIPTQYNRYNFIDSSRFTTGMLEVHEYFHALQRIPMMGKDLGRYGWPRAWIREGSAEWVQNAVIFSNNFENYQKFIDQDCLSEFGKMSESEISDYLGAANDDVAVHPTSNHIDYCMGAFAIESLVSLKGPGSVIDLYIEMGNRSTFDAAFKTVYGEEWKVALPILAKTVYARWRNK